MAFPQPLTSVPIVDSDLRPSLSWRLYLPRLDAAIRGLVGTTTFSSTLVVAVDDAAAAAAGVQVGQLYRTPTTGVIPHTVSVVQVRVN